MRSVLATADARREEWQLHVKQAESEKGGLESSIAERHIYEGGVVNEILEVGVFLFHSISTPSLLL